MGSGGVFSIRRKTSSPFSWSVSFGVSGMFPSRQQFKFQIAPTDRQLWAIGMVAVTWTLIENIMQLVASGLCKDDAEALTKFEQTRSFKIRLELLKAIIEQKMASPHKEVFLALVQETKATQQLRDRIIHGTWGGEEQNSPVSPFNWMKPHPPFQWKLDFGGIKKVAIRIDGLLAQWYEAILKGETGDNILMSDALQRKCRKPSPSP